MLNAASVFVLLIGWWAGYHIGFSLNLVMKSKNNILPWIGILRIKSDTNHTDAATGLIMIRKHLAVGNANEVANIKIKTLRKFAKAMFFRNHIWWVCSVSDCIIHPEYFTGVKNTIAIVHLNSNQGDAYWTPINWPTINTTHDIVYSVSLTDRHRELHQIINRMELVKDSDCEDFYKKEKLNYKSLQPSYSLCYKMPNSVKQCVIDAGMALAVASGNTWTLIGISTFGPGCSLPSRFIQFLPYIPWINSHSTPEKSLKSLQNFRRSKDFAQDTEPYEDQDTLLLQKINDSTIVMRPSFAYLKEEVYGRCDTIDGVLLYREFGTIRAPTYTATAAYSISLFDLFFPRVTCVLVTVMCNQRSKTRYWVTLGFHQEDIEDYVKIIPAPKRNATKAPKIWYIKDTYKKYRTIETANLEFKFEFTNEAKMDLEFYGLNISTPMRPPPVPFLPKQKQTSGKLPDGADFNARDDETDDDLDTNDSFYHF